MKSKIRGAGGGGGGGGGGQPPRTPVEDPDSLRSRAFIRIVDLVSEGEIEGLVDGQKSVYFNETPWVSESGTENFRGIDAETRNGTQDQTYISGFDAVESELSVGVEVLHVGNNGLDGAIVRQITNPNVERARVRISVSQLTRTNTETGDVHGTEVDLAIDVQPDGGSYTRVKERRIAGKTTSKYEITVDVDLPGNAPWNLRVVRTTTDSTSSYVQSRTFFESYTEIIDAKLRYPNSAIVALRADSQQFQSVPARAYDIKGLKIRVPDNYDPETREYTGEWSGDFQVAWTDNPAWVFYDLLTSERYGLGGFIDADQVDKWGLYEIAQYCDELVPDGFGGLEPRFTCNLVLSDRAEAYTVVQNLASVFRAMIYWSTGAVTLSQDAPQDAAYLYTPANVMGGKFTYQGASAKARHTVALVSWNDPEDFCKMKVEYVEDQPGIAKYGVQEAEIVAFGCTSRGQAHRLGKWLLYTEQNESETVTFKTGIEGLVSRPGQVIKIADPTRAGVRYGGRIRAATTTSITVDSMPAGAFNGSTISVVLPTGVEERTVIGQSGNEFTIQPELSAVPQVQSVWILKNDTVEPQWFRVISVKEEDGGVYALTALRHDPDKFDAVERDLILDPKSYSILSAVPSPPVNLLVTEALYQTGSEVKAKLTVSWDPVTGASAYILRYKYANDNFIETPEFSFNEREVFDVIPGQYTFQVYAISPLGKKSVASEIVQEVYGTSAPPSDVENFSMIPNAGQAYLTWTKSTDLDVLVGGQVRIRHSPRTTGQQWQDSIDIIPAVAGSSTSALAPLLTGTYFARFVDASGNYSVNDSLIVTTVPDGIALNVVVTETEHPDFAGVKTNMVNYEFESEDSLVLASVGLIDDVLDIDSLGLIDFTGDIASEGTYEFENTIDLGGVWPARIRSLIDLEAFDIRNLIDERTDLIDSWLDIDGDVVTDVNAELYVRTTEDDPGGSPTWTEWKRIHAGQYSARGFQFYLLCTSGSPNHNLFIRQLEVTIDVEDRVEHLGPITSSVLGIYTITYAFPFYAVPAISVTANDMNSGDFYAITNADEEGFDILFKNAASSNVARTFSVIAKGYGRKLA